MAGRAGPSEDCGLDPEWDGKPQAGFAQSRDMAQLPFEWGHPGCHSGCEDGLEQGGDCSR